MKRQSVRKGHCYQTMVPALNQTKSKLIIKPTKVKDDHESITDTIIIIMY
jgi:hypothetical protein